MDSNIEKFVHGLIYEYEIGEHIRTLGPWTDSEANPYK